MTSWYTCDHGVDLGAARCYRCEELGIPDPATIRKELTKKARKKKIKPKVIAKFKQMVYLSVDPHEEKRIREAINLHHIGKKEVPLNEEFPPGKDGMSMVEVHHNLSMSHGIEVTVQVLEDGSLVLKR